MTPDSILTAVCIASGVTPKELTGGLRNRNPRVVRARQVAVYLLRQHTLLSYPQIAVLFGQKPTSHSTMQERHKAAWWSVRHHDVEFINALDASREALAEQKGEQP